MPYYKPMKVASKSGSQSFGSQESNNGRFGDIVLQPDTTKYKLHAVIGKGSFENVTVHLAQHIPSGQKIAIKCIDIENSPVEFNIFQDEVILCRQMCHENIAKYLCTFVNNNELWSVMPLLGYGSARDVLHAYFKTGLPETAIAYILRDVLNALEYLHHRGIIHRSVRASHILIGGNGSVCLSAYAKSTTCSIMAGSGTRFITTPRPVVPTCSGSVQKSLSRICQDMTQNQTYTASESQVGSWPMVILRLRTCQ